MKDESGHERGRLWTAIGRVGRSAAAVSLWMAIALPGFAQDVRVQVERGPYYVGEGFEVQVIATDFEEDPQPEIDPGPPTGGQLRYQGVSPSTSTSISFINGKMSRVHEVTFVYRYQFTGTQPGRARIPAFRVAQDDSSGSTTSRNTKPFEVDIVGVPPTDQVAIHVEIPEGPVFVGQKIPIAVEFTIDRQTQRDLLSYQIHLPLFDDPRLRFLDDPPPDPDTHIEVESEAGTLRLPATSSDTRLQGRDALRVRAERTMIPLSTGELRLDSPKVFVSVGAGFRRDVFNQRRATSTEKFMAEGNPIGLEIAEVPRQGRPESFAGAVGSGFSLEVEADRSVVQLGEPIMLSFHLRGDGDLSMASLPPLDAEGLLDPDRFRLPEESPAGIVDENGKHFDVTLRVLDANVREIPALDYSWFDAGSRRFETTRSRPIALSVGAAEIIGAEAVERGGGAVVEVDADFDASEELPAPSTDGVTRSSRMSMTGANLAVDRDLDRLLRRDGGRDAGAMRVLPFYAAGLGFLGLAGFLSRRLAADPAVMAKQRAYHRARRGIDEAVALSSGGAAMLGRVLRELLAAFPEEAGAELDALIAECDNLRFAPGQADAERGPGVPEALAERARRLIEERTRTSAARGEDA